MLIIPPHQRQRNVENFARFVASRSRDGRRHEIEAICADGSIFPGEVSVAAVPLPEGSFFTVYLRDLTAERHAEPEIQRQREALQRSEKMAAFSSLLAGVAHDLNNRSQS